MPESRTERQDRGYAISAGIFFIIATFLLFVGEAFYKPVLEAADVLDRAAAERGTIVTGVLIETVCVFAIPMVAVSFYPVLKRFGTGMALAYVVFRTLEAAFFGVKEMIKLSMIDISQIYLQADAAGQYAVTAIGAFVGAQMAFSSVAGVVYLIAFILGTLVINWQMYVTRLVPRWIALFGLLSIAVFVVATLLNALNTTPPDWAFYLLLPIAVQEMVFAVWLIVRGFDKTALAQSTWAME